MSEARFSPGSLTPVALLLPPALWSPVSRALSPPSPGLQSRLPGQAGRNHELPPPPSQLTPRLASLGDLVRAPHALRRGPRPGVQVASTLPHRGSFQHDLPCPNEAAGIAENRACPSCVSSAHSRRDTIAGRGDSGMQEMDSVCRLLRSPGLSRWLDTEGNGPSTSEWPDEKKRPSMHSEGEEGSEKPHPPPLEVTENRGANGRKELATGGVGVWEEEGGEELCPGSSRRPGTICIHRLMEGAGVFKWGSEIIGTFTAIVLATVRTGTGSHLGGSSC